MILRILFAFITTTVATCSLLMANYAGAASLSAPEEVTDNLRKGIAQEVFVQIDNREINKELERKRIAKGLISQDQELIDESSKRLTALKNEIFPNGRLGDIKVIKDYSHLPQVMVLVPNIDALNLLLKSPKITGIYENQKYYLPVRP